MHIYSGQDKYLPLYKRLADVIVRAFFNWNKHCVLLYRGDTDTPPPSPPSPPTSVIFRIFAVVLAMGYQTKSTAAADYPRNKI